jgi:hypothetical protein
MILPVVLYGYETWSLTLREEHRLRVNKAIMGPSNATILLLLFRCTPVLHCLPPDDGRMIETCCGNNIGREEEL